MIKSFYSIFIIIVYVIKINKFCLKYYLDMYIEDNLRYAFFVPRIGSRIGDIFATSQNNKNVNQVRLFSP